MNLESLISHYGYAALLVGTLFEGETIVVLAGLAAQRGYLELPWVIFVAFAGTYACDQFLFYLGRSKGARFLESRPRWKRKSEAVLGRLRRHPTAVILGFRFAYGFRTVTPFAIGMSGVRPLLFFVLNGISAAIWATVIAFLGFLFGKAIEGLIDEVKRYELLVFLFVAAIGAVVWAVRRRRNAKTGRTGSPPPPPSETGRGSGPDAP